MGITLSLLVKGHERTPCYLAVKRVASEPSTTTSWLKAFCFPGSRLVSNLTSLLNSATCTTLSTTLTLAAAISFLNSAYSLLLQLQHHLLFRTPTTTSIMFAAGSGGRRKSSGTVAKAAAASAARALEASGISAEVAARTAT